MLQIFEIKNPFERRVYARNVECTGKPLSSYLPADGQFDVFINAHQVRALSRRFRATVTRLCIARMSAAVALREYSDLSR